MQLKEEIRLNHREKLFLSGSERISKDETMTNSEIQKLHRDAVVCLSYVNPWIVYSREGLSAHRYFTESAHWMEATIPMMRKGGVDVVVLSHGNPDANRFPGGQGVELLLKSFDAIRLEIEKNPGLVLILTRRDLDEAVKKGKMGIILGITGNPFNGDLANLRAFFHMGIRTVHPFANDPATGGFAGGPKELGLKPFGRKLIREMERLGMVVDITHTNDKTFAEVLRFAERPVINSHTNCRELAEYDRCCTDQQLRSMAGKGLLGVHFGFVEKPNHVAAAKDKKRMDKFRRKMEAMQRKYKDPYEFLQHRNDPFEWPISLGGAVDDGTPIARAKLSQLGDHIERMVKMAGIDHVCIGTDYSSGEMPEGVETAETLVNLTAELVRRGFTASEIKKIWGENFLRLFREILPAH